MGAGSKSPDPSWIKSLMDFPIPENSSQLKQLLGFFAYNGKWVADYSQKVAPLLAAQKQLAFPLNQASRITIPTLKTEVAAALLCIHWANESNSSCVKNWQIASLALETIGMQLRTRLSRGVLWRPLSISDHTAQQLNLTRYSCAAGSDPTVRVHSETQSPKILRWGKKGCRQLQNVLSMKTALFAAARQQSYPILQTLDATINLQCWP